MQHSKFLTSLIIPTYNEERFLPKTLASISRLLHKPQEVIVVDSASTDRTVKIAKDFSARVVKAPQRGIGLARQIGLEAAKYPIVAYTDADTIVPPAWLKVIHDTLSKTGVVGVYGGYRVYDGWLPYRFLVNYVNPLHFSISAFFSKIYAVGQNIAFFKQKGIQAGGFPVDFRSVEDIEFLRRLQKVGKVVYIKNNWVLSSGRRGKEGLALIPRKTKGLLRYLLIRKAESFTFPDFR